MSRASRSGTRTCPRACAARTRASSASPRIEHLHRLGVTAVELLPVHQHVDDRRWSSAGLSNYWGYNTIGFFAPDARYSATGEPVSEFKTMVKRLHDAGHRGDPRRRLQPHRRGQPPRVRRCRFRGIDNAAYYRLDPDDRRRYVDYTGTRQHARTCTHPRVLQLIMDSLRYWITEMHVDGFRFDLASTLARELHDVDKLGSFFDIIHQDPLISPGEAHRRAVGRRRRAATRSATSRSAGPSGTAATATRCAASGRAMGGRRRSWRIGSAARPTSMRSRAPAACQHQLHHLARRLHARATSSSYEGKHNEANGEENRDGDNDNSSRNFGVEGETDDPAIRDVRERQVRNLLATLFLSQGVPMLLGGDEIGRTPAGQQQRLLPGQRDQLVRLGARPSRSSSSSTFTRGLIGLFGRHPVCAAASFFQGRPIRGSRVKDLTWFGPDGRGDDR